jgi:hypothetical protein
VTIRFLVLAVLAPIPICAQVSITGRLIDPSETPVGGVAVVLRQGENQLSTLTSETGQFRFDRVRVGEYELLTTVPGFDPVRRQIRVGQQPSRGLVIRLKLAVLKEEVEVAEQDRQVSVAPGQNADTISVERTMLDNLPMLDNNYLNALARFLNPGTPGDAGTSIIVDGMESRNVGVTASAIQEIRINNNPYTVEYLFRPLLKPLPHPELGAQPTRRYPRPSGPGLRETGAARRSASRRSAVDRQCDARWCHQHLAARFEHVP